METIHIAALLGATSSKFPSERDTRVNITSESIALLLRNIMDLMCEWVKYFNINLYVPPTRISLKAARETSAFCLLLFLHLCTSDCATSLFPPTSFPQPFTRSALFIIVYLERTCFIRQAVLPSPIDCKASVD